MVFYSSPLMPKSKIELKSGKMYNIIKRAGEDYKNTHFLYVITIIIYFAYKTNMFFGELWKLNL